MAIIYCDDDGLRRKGGLKIDLHKINPHNPYSKHLDNWYYLKFLLTNSKDWNEQRQAQKELAICERKLAYWNRHPAWDPIEAGKLTKTVKSRWATEIEPILSK